MLLSSSGWLNKRKLAMMSQKVPLYSCL